MTLRTAWLALWKRVSHLRPAAQWPALAREAATYLPDVDEAELRAMHEHQQALARNRVQRADEKLRTWAKGAEPPELRRRARSLARRHAGAQATGNTKQAFVFGRMAQVVEDEIDARQLRGDWPQPRRRRQRSADPPLLAVVASVPPQGASSGVCSLPARGEGSPAGMAPEPDQTAPPAASRIVVSPSLDWSDFPTLQVKRARDVLEVAA